MKKIITEVKLYILIGERIKSVREQKGITQQDLAARCDFEKSNLSRIEAGRTNLTIKSLFKISTALDVEIKDLVDVYQASIEPT